MDIVDIIVLVLLVANCALVLNARSYFKETLRRVEQQAPFFESLTESKIVIHGKACTIRVWRHQSIRQFAGDDVVFTLIECREWRTARELADALDALPDVAAYQISDTHGHGGVVYREWP